MREVNKRGVMAAVIAALLGGVATARADGISTTFSGYGTLGGTFTSDTAFQYRHDPSEFSGAAEQFNVGLESRLGLQALIDFGSGFSVTAQELARKRGDNEFSLGTEWLYLQYAPNSDLKFRLGRVVLATFLLSDSREVGYAAPWFRAPNEMYGTQILQNLDGEQIVWSTRVGPIGLNLQGSFGNTRAYQQSLTAGAFIPIKNIYNVSLAADYSDLLVRVSQTQSNISASIPLGPTTVDLAIIDKITSLGLQYDNGKAILMSEWARILDNHIPIINEIVDDIRMWYVAGGWRFGKLTPMVIYGKYDPAQSLANNAGRFGTWSASLRYDVVRNIALKAQISRPQADNNVYWVAANPASSARINVVSLGADFVF